MSEVILLINSDRVAIVEPRRMGRDQESCKIGLVID